MRRRHASTLALLLLTGCASAGVDQEAMRAKEGDMQRIETQRLVLRPFTPDDWKDFQELALDWAAAPGPAFDKFPTSADGCQQSVRYMATSDSYYAMSLRGSGKVVGLLAINGIDERKQADLGHVILSEYQDNDHDREALAAMVAHCFDVRGVDSIVARNASEHAAQIAPLRSLGFTATNPQNPGELTLDRAGWERRSPAAAP